MTQSYLLTRDFVIRTILDLVRPYGGFAGAQNYIFAYSLLVLNFHNETGTFKITVIKRSSV